MYKLSVHKDAEKALNKVQILRSQNPQELSHIFSNRRRDSLHPFSRYSQCFGNRVIPHERKDPR